MGMGDPNISRFLRSTPIHSTRKYQKIPFKTLQQNIPKNIFPKTPLPKIFKNISACAPYLDCYRSCPGLFPYLPHSGKSVPGAIGIAKRTRIQHIVVVRNCRQIKDSRVLTVIWARAVCRHTSNLSWPKEAIRPEWHGLPHH